jgi:hypothetical protein
MSGVSGSSERSNMTDDATERVRLMDDFGFVHFEPKTEYVGQGGRLGFLNTDTWLDADGYHIWCAHDCLGERVVTMLPWPTWQANERGHIRPSFACDRCGTHASNLTLNRTLT